MTGVQVLLPISLPLLLVILSLMTLSSLQRPGGHLPLQGELLHQVAHVAMLEPIKMVQLSIGVYQLMAANMILQ